MIENIQWLIYTGAPGAEWLVFAFFSLFIGCPILILVTLLAYVFRRN